MINIFASLLLSLSVNAASVPTFTSCSGVPYTPDPEWNMEVSFLDEFNGTVLDETKWSIIEGDLGFNAESQVYTNSSLSVADGKLAITAGYNPSGGETPYTSGRIDTQGKYAFQYGVFEACVKFPEVKGLWPAAWLLGNKYNGSNTEANGWPDCGEIDVLEYQTAWNKDGKTTTLTTLHTAANNSGNGITQGVPLDNPSEYHLYAVDRKYDSIVFYRDGQVVFNVSRPADASEYNWPYDQDFFIILNMAIGPKWGDSYLPDSSSSIEGQQMLIDWVRVLTPKEEEAQA